MPNEWITANELKEYEYVDSEIRQTKASPGNAKECLSQVSFVRQSVRVPWPESNSSWLLLKSFGGCLHCENSYTYSSDRQWMKDLSFNSRQNQAGIYVAGLWTKSRLFKSQKIRVFTGIIWRLDLNSDLSVKHPQSNLNSSLQYI